MKEQTGPYSLFSPFRALPFRMNSRVMHEIWHQSPGSLLAFEKTSRLSIRRWPLRTAPINCFPISKSFHGYSLFGMGSYYVGFFVTNLAFVVSNPRVRFIILLGRPWSDLEQGIDLDVSFSFQLPIIPREKLVFLFSYCSVSYIESNTVNVVHRKQPW